MAHYRMISFYPMKELPIRPRMMSRIISIEDQFHSWIENSGDIKIDKVIENKSGIIILYHKIIPNVLKCSTRS